MTFADLLIIYLAFGAPLAVYKYLQTRGAGRHRRILISILTFFVWLPVALEIGYLYLRNAYSKDGFVSKKVLDSDESRLQDMQDAIISDLFRNVKGSSLHDIRETVDRYTGLTQEIQSEALPASRTVDLFEAAGRRNYSAGQACLMRRNLSRLKRHHTQARRDFVKMLGDAAGSYTLTHAVEQSIGLATQLGDAETIRRLKALKPETGEVWKPELHNQSQSIKTVAPIVMTATLNNE